VLNGCTTLTPPETAPTPIFRSFFRLWLRTRVGHLLPDEVHIAVDLSKRDGQVPLGQGDLASVPTCFPEAPQLRVLAVKQLRVGAFLAEQKLLRSAETFR